MIHAYENDLFVISVFCRHIFAEAIHVRRTIFHLRRVFNKSIFFKTIRASLCSISFCCAVVCFQHRSAAQQPETGIVAHVGNRVVTASEFANRFALTIFPYKDAARSPGRPDALKKEFLYSLIAEKLLAQEAQRRNIGSDERFIASKRFALEMCMRDKLYRGEIRSKVHISEKEIRDRFAAQRKKVEFQFLFTRSEAKIKKLRKLLDEGMSFDMLLAAEQTPIDDAANSEETSNLESLLRKNIRSLNAGEISPPIKTDFGYYIVRKMPEGSIDGKEELFQKERRSIERKLRNEKEYARSINFVRSLWKGKKAVIQKERFAVIGRALKKDLADQSMRDSTDVFHPGLFVFDDLRKKFSIAIGEHFCLIHTDSITVKYFLDRLERKSFQIKRSELKNFPQIFRTITRDIIDEHLITREAYRRGLDSDEEVKSELARWSDNGLAQSFVNDVWEQFITNDDSVWNFYMHNAELFGPPLEVKIAEVFHDSIDTLQHVVKQLKHGASIRKMISYYSKRHDPDVVKRSEQYFPITQYPIIGRTAWRMNVNDQSEILKMQDGYSVYQLLDKRKINDSAISTYDELRTQITSRLKNSLQYKLTERLVTDLTKKASIEIHDHVLNAIQVEPMQMFTIRYLGFGGKIPAVPGVMPLYEAVMEGIGKRNAPQP